MPIVITQLSKILLGESIVFHSNDESINFLHVSSLHIQLILQRECSFLYVICRLWFEITDRQIGLGTIMFLVTLQSRMFSRKEEPR